ncbi:hypothetical protein [Nocardioides rubriscoriae]|uniref:hypothetical protein n=1 Tax=Nocardioides rubriscoriae TaxID=642762 RepID=UPI0011E04ABF|nr:hypothetical protein [Nocardioides rubriscoriae]
MTISPVLRLSAVCGFLSGLLIAVPGVIDGFVGESTTTSVLLSFSPALAIVLVVGLHATQVERAGRFGVLAYGVNLVGTGLFAGVAFALNGVLFFLDDATVTELRNGPTGVLLAVDGLIFVVGAVLFGASLIRAGVHPRPAAWTYTLAVPALAVTSRLEESPGTALVHLLVGGSMVALAWGLWRTAPLQAPVEPVPAGRVGSVS